MNAHIDPRTEAILDAAMKMIVQKDVHGATIVEIATEACQFAVIFGRDLTSLGASPIPPQTSLI